MNHSSRVSTSHCLVTVIPSDSRCAVAGSTSTPVDNIAVINARYSQLHSMILGLVNQMQNDSILRLPDYEDVDDYTSEEYQQMPNLVSTGTCKRDESHDFN